MILAEVVILKTVFLNKELNTRYIKQNKTKAFYLFCVFCLTSFKPQNK